MVGVPDSLGQAVGVLVVVVALLALLGFSFAVDKAHYALEVMRILFRDRRR